MHKIIGRKYLALEFFSSYFVNYQEECLYFLWRTSKTHREFLIKNYKALNKLIPQVLQIFLRNFDEKENFDNLCGFLHPKRYLYYIDLHCVYPEEAIVFLDKLKIISSILRKNIRIRNLSIELDQ